MIRWLLVAVLATGMLVSARADDNPFRKSSTPSTQKKPDEQVKSDESKSSARVAHFKLTGEMDESPLPDEHLFGPPPENFSSKLERIRKAIKDDEIQGIYLEIKDLEVGFGKLHELRKVLESARAAGKKVFAYSEEFSSKGYLLAAGSDQIGMPELGDLMLVGLRAEVTFYKNTLELLRLKADVLKVGDYKSAVEPFLRDSMSKENREQIESMLDDNFQHELVLPVAAGRKMSPGKVKEIIDQGPFSASRAKAMGLIDVIAYEQDFEAGFNKIFGAKKVTIERNYAKPKAAKLDLSNPFALMEAFAGPKKARESKEDKIAVIYAVGSIVSGKGGQGNPLFGSGSEVGSDTIIAAVRKAEKDPTVKAIVLRIDSPGGSAGASDLMWNELRKCKKPLVASMGDVAASGGYYIAMPAKKIYAEPGTITGSIGVFGLKLVTGGLQEWAGMKTEVIQRGKNTGVMSSTFEWSDSERKVLSDVVAEVYDHFTRKAAMGRQAAGKNLTQDDIKRLGGGRVWTGRQAKENGLIDELGTLDDAIAGAKKLAGIDPKKQMELLVLPKPLSFLEQLMEGESKLPFLGQARSELMVLPGMDKVMKMAAPLLATQKDFVKALVPFHVEFK